jgi:hypothetical protein
MGETADQAKTLVDRIGPHGRVVAANTLLPGVLVLFELWLFVYWDSIRKAGGGHGDAILKFLIDTTANMNAFAGAVVLVVGFAATYAVGALCCAATWVVWLGLRHLAPQAHGGALVAATQDAYGDEAVRTALAQHPGLRSALHMRGAAWSIESPDSFVLGYCKSWLRMHASSMAVDHFEAEINLLLGLVIPTGLAGARRLRRAQAAPGAPPRVPELCPGAAVRSAVRGPLCQEDTARRRDRAAQPAGNPRPLRRQCSRQ